LIRNKKNAEADVKTRKILSANGDALADLYGRPAFMIRRAHQIATSIFTSSCAELELTPSQFSLMFVLRHRGPVGQNELGRLVSLDRSTTALVVRGLRARELVDTSPDPSDRRKMIVRLTDKGRLLLSRAEKLSTKASDKLLSAFDPRQASAFLSLLETLTSSLSAEAVDARPAGSIQCSDPSAPRADRHARTPPPTAPGSAQTARSHPSLLAKRTKKCEW
jgi:DNA-binding MarR family transcriptional regulator